MKNALSSGRQSCCHYAYLGSLSSITNVADLPVGPEGTAIYLSKTTSTFFGIGCDVLGAHANSSSWADREILFKIISL